VTFGKQVAVEQCLHHLLGFERLTGRFPQPLGRDVDRGLVVPGDGLAVIELAIEAISVRSTSVTSTSRMRTAMPAIQAAPSARTFSSSEHSLDSTA
jgi:hypothetical protein